MRKTAGLDPEDVYFKKTVPLNFRKQSLVFRTSQELFSSHDIDQGTRFLLRTIAEAGYPAAGYVLDLGCGYGPLGLTLKKLCPGSFVHMTDRDALALEYTSQNAVLNGLEGVEVYGSLGYDDIRRNAFDLIVSNIPGKAGEKVIAGLLKETRFHLTPAGVAAIVVVSPLDELAGGVLAETPGMEVILKETRSAHSVFHFRSGGKPATAENNPDALEREPRRVDFQASHPGAFEWGLYERDRQVFRFSGIDYTMQTAFGLPEFDSLDYRSEMLMKALAGQPRKDVLKACVFNPGQGHTAVMLWNLYHPQNITLIDRDLLALRYAGLNLRSNGCPAENINLFHQAGLSAVSGGEYNLIIALLREEEGERALELTLRQASAGLSGAGTLLVTAGSTAIARLTSFLRRYSLLRIQAREKWKGNGLLTLSIPPCS